jgi:cell division protein FtsN
MDEKRKGTKKTIADELLEDNFFKPPIDDIIDEASPEKNDIKEKGQEPQKGTEKDGGLLFDDFLKSPAESTQDEITELSTPEISELNPAASPGFQAAAPPGPHVVVARAAEETSSKLKLIIASLGTVVVLLIIGFVYIYMHHPETKPLQSDLMQGSQSVTIDHTKPGPVQAKPVAPKAVPEAQQSVPPAGNAEQKSNQPSNAQVAENVPPAVSPQQNNEVAKQFEVILENIKSKTALNDVKSIGKTMDNALSFDVVENKNANTSYSLFVDSVYPSEGEATADNLKLMVANISNASVVKADGGYRILVGKYNSKARAMSNIKNIQAAGLKGLIKETQNTTYTYNVKVYPFKSAKEAETYKAKVKRLAVKVTSTEMK